MTAVVVVQCLALAANCIMLVLLTGKVREFAAELQGKANAVPDAAAVIVTNLARLEAKLSLLLEGGVRIEAAAVVVADDLADAHYRADQAVGPSGAAADAAARTDER